MARLDDAKIKELLLQGSYASEEDIRKAEEFAASRRVSIVEYLLGENIISKDILGQAIAEYMGVPYADLNSYQPPRRQVQKIPEEAARKYRIVIFQEGPDAMTVTSDDPRQEGIREALGVLAEGKKVALAYSLGEDIDEAFVNYRKPLETRFGEIIAAGVKIAPEIIDEIVGDAVLYRASDIHFEPQEEEVIVRFRIDGVLHEAGRIPRDVYDDVLNRAKIMANLRIDEHNAPQDGAIRFRGKKDGSAVDMRVSIIPTLDGEKLVVRLLAEYVKGFRLSDLGLPSDVQLHLKESSGKPFGMILVTGPTGSGKTTTLYALLKILNRSEVNITTIEDPVEYKIPGISQIQVNPKIDLTFARGLRTIVRQDPDIILVGEIRDEETAEISVNAALTGHLLFSTFHSNDAATTIPRLLDMGVEPFLLSSTLELVIAQRLVRRICGECRVSFSEDVEKIRAFVPRAEQYFDERTVTLYRGKGCRTCSGIGYKGRTAIVEFISVSQELRELILKNPSSQQIWDVALEEGSRYLFDDGMEKVKKGITTVEELLRVAAPPSRRGPAFTDEGGR